MHSATAPDIASVGATRSSSSAAEPSCVEGKSGVVEDATSGGTTIGAVYLTCDNISPAILEHEAVHRAQWKRYGLAFLPLYLDAGQDAHANRFEIEAGLMKGGYLK